MGWVCEYGRGWGAGTRGKYGVMVGRVCVEMGREGVTGPTNVLGQWCVLTTMWEGKGRCGNQGWLGWCIRGSPLMWQQCVNGWCGAHGRRGHNRDRSVGQAWGVGEGSVWERE